MGLDNKALEGLARREAASTQVNTSITRTKYCTEIVDAICDGLVAGLSIKAVCGIVNIDESTFYRWKEKHPDFKEAVDSTRPAFEAQMLEIIKHQAHDDWRAAAWILDRRYPREWGARKELDLNVNRTDGTEQVLSFIKQAHEKLKSPANNS